MQPKVLRSFPRARTGRGRIPPATLGAPPSPAHRPQIQISKIKRASAQAPTNRLTERKLGDGPIHSGDWCRQDCRPQRRFQARDQSRQPRPQRKSPEPDRRRSLPFQPAHQGADIGNGLLRGLKHSFEITGDEILRRASSGSALHVIGQLHSGRVDSRDVQPRAQPRKHFLVTKLRIPPVQKNDRGTFALGLILTIDPAEDGVILRGCRLNGGSKSEPPVIAPLEIRRDGRRLKVVFSKRRPQRAELQWCAQAPQNIPAGQLNDPPVDRSNHPRAHTRSYVRPLHETTVEVWRFPNAVSGRRPPVPKGLRPVGAKR